MSYNPDPANTWLIRQGVGGHGGSATVTGTGTATNGDNGTPLGALS